MVLFVGLKLKSVINLTLDLRKMYFLKMSLASF